MPNLVYYFDGSDVAATDPNNSWTSDANAFDGDLTTYAFQGSATTETTGYLMAEGTNAPSTGETITSVSARIYGTNGVNNSFPVYATIYTNGLAEKLGTCSSVTVVRPLVGYGPTYDLSVPSGGWTWTGVQALEVKIFGDPGFYGSFNVARVDIIINNVGSPPPSIYRIQGFQ